MSKPLSKHILAFIQGKLSENELRNTLHDKNETRSAAVSKKESQSQLSRNKRE